MADAKPTSNVFTAILFLALVSLVAGFAFVLYRTYALGLDFFTMPS